MNLELLNPFESDFPEIIEECLDDGFATTCSFNRHGTLLAVGCSDGRCVLWDFETRGVARTLHGHVRAITSVSWSRNGRKLLTSSNDWNIILWDVETCSKDVTMSLGTMVLLAQMHPRSSNLCIACPWMSAPVLVDLEKQEKHVLNVQKERDEEPVFQQSKQPKVGYSALAAFNKRGDKIYVGSAKGTISVIDTDTHELEKSLKVPGSAAIKSIQFSRDGHNLLVNSSDRVIRVFNVDSCELLREFQDYVNRMQWKKCCFGGDSDYIIGGSAQKAEHNIYIWNKTFGQLVKILEGPKEGIMDLVWHPCRPVIASCSTSGTVYIWAKNYTENWSAFAPDFKELEANEDYEEREDEFDIVPEDETKKRRALIEDEGVDILAVDGRGGLDSDDDDPFFLPTVPEPDPGVPIPQDIVDDEATRKSKAKPKREDGDGAEEWALSSGPTKKRKEPAR
mmetsp:Transcript_12889/g.21066  ORF Transcript_12889/g.21066 Transcript_12889/m.21066 type:complete len:451 (+) Transcript_12889:28-1380(+)